MKTKYNIREYIGVDKFFRIPAYQRGYKWSVPNKNIGSSLEILLDDIISAMDAEKDEYFIQGITGAIQENIIDLIDGQQRTTTLFLIFKQLLDPSEQEKYLYIKNNMEKRFKLIYEIRDSSQKYLESENEEEPNTQDVYYFKEAKRQIEEKLKNIDREKFKKYLLSNVKLFFTSIPIEQASNVFSMLNGAKAFMKTDELIKAEMLCKGSSIVISPVVCNTTEDLFKQLERQIGIDWEINSLRSMLARQWDKWLYWWNRPEVKAFFHAGNNPLGRLLEFFSSKEKIPYSNSTENVVAVFKAFQNKFITDPIATKNNFEELRKLQKKFEDIFSSVPLYNNLGLLLETQPQGDHCEIIKFFLEYKKDLIIIRKYTLLKLCNQTLKKEISPENQDVITTMLELLHNKNIYNGEGDEKEHAYRQLFRLNVDAATKRNVKFDFFITVNVNEKRLKSFYQDRSLEHIWPKSRHDEVDTELLHCIGNLLFLHKNDNSKFNAKEPEEKKKIYFDLKQELFSRSLLHTMSVFAYDNWSKENVSECIKKNKERVIEQITEDYKNCLGGKK